MNKLLKIIIIECLLNWLIASCIIFTISVYIDNNLLKILSCISILISKITYEDYASKFYLHYNKPIKSKFEFEVVK